MSAVLFVNSKIYQLYYVSLAQECQNHSLFLVVRAEENFKHSICVSCCLQLVSAERDFSASLREPLTTAGTKGGLAYPFPATTRFCCTHPCGKKKGFCRVISQELQQGRIIRQ